MWPLFLGFRPFNLKILLKLTVKASKLAYCSPLRASQGNGGLKWPLIGQKCALYSKQIYSGQKCAQKFHKSADWQEDSKTGKKTFDANFALKFFLKKLFFIYISFTIHSLTDEDLFRSKYILSWKLNLVVHN